VVERITKRQFWDWAYLGLVFANERTLVFCFGLEHDERKSFGVQQKEIGKSRARFLKVITQRVEIG
jgi:hypothetical protein